MAFCWAVRFGLNQAWLRKMACKCRITAAEVRPWGLLTAKMAFLILDGGWGNYREGSLPKRPCGAIAIIDIGGCEGEGDGEVGGGDDDGVVVGGLLYRQPVAP